MSCIDNACTEHKQRANRADESKALGQKLLQQARLKTRIQTSLKTKF